MVRVTEKALDLQEIIAYVGDPEAGAVATFIGTARNHNEGRKVTSLEYEAYPEMAEKELAQLGQEAKEQWKLCRLAIVLRR
jgi:molybdopterin synthase catalytic subunit